MAIFGTAPNVHRMINRTKNVKRGIILSLCLARLLAGTAQKNYPEVSGKFQAYYNQNKPDSIFEMFSSKVNKILTIDKTNQMVQQLRNQLGNLDSIDLIKQDDRAASYKAIFDKSTLALVIALDSSGKIDGLRFNAYQPELLHQLKDTSNFNVSFAGGTIYATLTEPNTTHKLPVIVIIAGSGPTDRNGNSFAGLNTNAYRMLADSLKMDGIACLRYDKRGVGESKTESKAAMTFDDMIKDAVSIIRKLRADNRFSKVIVLGHSEGSLIGMIAARQANADAFISLAGAGQTIDKILIRQISEQSKSLAAKSSLILDSLHKGYRVKNTDSLESLFSPANQPYLKSWLSYDPRSEIKQLTVPILIIQGTTDLQVSIEDADILKAANQRAGLKIIQNMNHILKESPGDRKENMATYNMPGLPIKAELVSCIEAFVKNLDGKQ